LQQQAGKWLPEPRITAAVQTGPSGYTVEIAMPLAMIGAGVGLAVADVDGAGGELIDLLGTSGRDSPDALVPVFIPEIELARMVKGFAPAASRIWVLDDRRRVLAQAGSLRREAQAAGKQTAEESWWSLAAEQVREATLRRVYRLTLQAPAQDFTDDLANASLIEGEDVRSALTGREATRWRLTPDSRAIVLSTAHPVYSGKQVVGVVVAEETTNDILALKNRALETLITSTFAAFSLAALALLAFTTRLSMRVRKLSGEALRAVDSRGRVRHLIAGSKSKDEIGDLSRSFSRALDNLAQYTGYLENMASRLSHELRTPIAVVRSSLDNLEMQPLAEHDRVYVTRAQEGIGRLSNILGSMTEATRLELAIGQHDKAPFELGAVLASCVVGYRMAYAPREIRLTLPAQPITLDGSADLIAQMLDKLVSNANDFATPGSAIDIELERRMVIARLTVSNEGPLLPEAMQGKLFESMVSVRAPAAGSTPHLGLGLHIVRLIVDYHAGRASIANRKDGRGVVVSIELPVRF
jgi:dedicated sortase system histidine kinase